MTSWLRFHDLPARQIEGATRPSHFTRPPRHLTDVDRAYVVSHLPLPVNLSEGFDPPDLIATVPIDTRGTTDGILNVRLYQKSKTGKTVEPANP